MILFGTLKSCLYICQTFKQYTKMKTLKYIQKLYPNCQILGISQVFYVNSGWTIFEKGILFFTYNSVNEKHFDKIIKSLISNEEMQITSINFNIISKDGENIYCDYSAKELLNIL